MESPDVTAVADEASAPKLSPIQRAVAVYAHPTQAWTGLDRQVQWWFPLMILLIVAAASSCLLQNRAILPMLSEAWDRQVSNGAMTSEQVDKMVTFFGSPAGMAISAVQQVIVFTLITLVAGLMVWFGVGFILGTKLKYRLSLEAAAWAGLISLPSYLLTSVLAWTKQTMMGVHVGFGILLPEMDPPSKLIVGLGVLLDGIGPFAIWYLAVLIIGASILSGAPRKSVAWTLSLLYVVLIAFSAALAALATPGS